MSTRVDDVFLWTSIFLSIGGCFGDAVSNPPATGDVAASATGAGCPLAQPVVLASGLGNQNRLEVNSSFVYFFATPPTGAIWRVAKEGGTKEFFTQVDVDDSFHWDYAVDDTTVYVMNSGTGETVGFGDGRVLLFNEDGTVRETISAKQAGDCNTTFLREIALGGDGSIYWLQESFSDPHKGPCPPEPSRVARVAPGATQPTLLATDGAQAANLLADAFHVFWSDENGIWRLSKAGGAPELMFGAPAVAHGMAIDANNILWTKVAPGEVQTNRISAPLVNTPIFAPVLDSIVSDGTFFYGTVARHAPGAPTNVIRMKANGHGQEVLAKGGILGPSLTGAVGGVAVDDTFVYYVDPSGTKILKACKSLE